jgi:hypothetical protein
VSRSDVDGFLAAQAWDYGDSEEKRRRVMRARAAKPTREARSARKRFRSECATAHELVLAHKGERSAYVLEVLTGSCAMGYAWAADIAAVMTRGHVAHGLIAEDDIRTMDSPLARELLTFGLRIIGLVERSDDHSKLSLRGQEAFWGQQHYVDVDMSPEECDLRRLHLEERRARVAERTHDRDFTRELHGEAPKLRAVEEWETRRKYLRTYDANGRHQSGGLAGRHKRSPRTIGRWGKLFQVAGVFRSKQPKAWAEDAVMPRVGSWAYGEWMLLREPSPTLMEKLQKCWGELDARRRRAGRPERRAAGEPKQHPQGSAGAPRGPPRDGSAPDPRDDWGASLGLTASELDDIEQTIGF